MSRPPFTPGMIHMASTEWYSARGSDGVVDSGYVVRCRCLWSSGPHPTRAEARRMGEWHLAEENGRPEGEP
jgi:hypothetical protein